MAELTESLTELVTANRILAREGVVDSFGHVSIRHPNQPDRYLMSRARAPECIELDDLMEFDVDGTAVDPRGRVPYAERFIHGAVYEARPEVKAVVHNHSPSVIPFSVTKAKLRPLLHMCASMGADIPVWDLRDRFGDTNLLVTSMPMGRDLAEALGDRRVSLMRGHGSVIVGGSLREVVFTSVYLEVNADLQMKASTLGEVTFLSDGEVQEILRTRSRSRSSEPGSAGARAPGRPYDHRPMEGPLAS